MKRGGFVELMILCILLPFCVWTDVKFRKVKNGWLLLGSLAGLTLRGMDFLAAAAAMLIPAFLLFRLGLLGGGDGKLMAVLTGCLGFFEGLTAIGFGMLAGIIWSLCFQKHKQSLWARLKHLLAYLRHIFLMGESTSFYQPDYIETENTIPLAAWMAAGVLVFFLISCCD